jgi:hypothetical protein
MHLDVNVRSTPRRYATETLSLRRSARDLWVSASLVSQIENRRVDTLYAICGALDFLNDELSATSEPAATTPVTETTPEFSPR